MKYKITFILLFLATCLSYGQEIASYNFITFSNQDPNLTATGLNSNDITLFGPISSNWETTNVINTDKYIQWTIDANATYELNLNSMDISYLTNDFIWFTGTDNAPTTVEIHIDINDGAGFNQIYTNNPTSGTIVNATIDLSAYTDLTNTISFRLYAYGATNNTGGNLGSLTIMPTPTDITKGIIVNGSVDPICPTTVTWVGGAWDNIVGPDITSSAIIDDIYNTAANGSFSACSLTVNTGNTLTIANGGYVEIENDITVDGSIIVNPEGSVVQNNDDGIVTQNGSIQVVKKTSWLNAWYEYTYWSSPVSGETIGDGLFESQPDRRFLFNGANFVDTTMETNNNNATINGQDDIDDDGNDWAFVGGATIMTPGVGYAATHSEALFIGPPFSTPPYQFDYIFEGPFNNGVITVPIYRNDSETNDNNWNLIGNPYPSAIDANAFLATNSNIATNIAHPGDLNGAIFLWSQNTAPSNTANGNENLNFAVADYAVINAIGQTAGGDGDTPNRYIPSGQGFFVTFSDAATPDSTTGDVSQGTVVFNNSMRVTGSNDQFFRTTSKNSDNKLWLNLTSDNGIFNQILVAYAKGATNGNDGMSFDTPKNLSTGASAILYSTIEGDAKKFVIQGKDVNSITEDEIINIGVKTSIDVPTIYALSIPQLEGDFLNNNAIYIKDNLLNKLHDLKDSDYTFTSEVGEFNDRFEIVFSEDALSLNDNVINEKALSIIEHKNGDVQFKMSGQNTMSAIQIIDLQGRILYNFKTDSSDLTFKLSNLSRAPYIAKVTLNNNHIITKKAIKKY